MTTQPLQPHASAHIGATTTTNYQPGYALATFTDPNGNWESLVTGDDGAGEFTVTLIDLQYDAVFVEVMARDYAEAVRIARELVQ